MTATRPSPVELWHQAGGDGAEYRRLLVEHGHLVPREPGDTSPMFACGYEPPEHRACRQPTDAERAALAGIEADRG